jgi:hypothetical protein
MDMSSKPLGIAALAVAMVAAAGVGSYLALKPGPTQAAPAEVVASASPAATPAASTGQAATPSPVTETEAAVTPSSSATPSAPAAPEASAPVEASRPAASSAPAARPRPRAERPAPAPSAPARVSQTPAATSRPAPASQQAPASTNATNGTARPSVPGRPSGTVPAEPGPWRDRPAETEQARVPPPVEAEPARPLPPPEPPKPTFVEYVLDSGSVMGLQIENTVSSSTAKLEDRVDARVTRDVRVGGETAVPAGSRLRGEVTLVEEGSKFRGSARLGIRFHTLVLADGSTVPIQTETIYREGEGMGTRSAAKIGGAAVGGAIIGAILGGGKGAAIGAGAGAGAGTAATAAGPRSQAVMQAGSTVTVRLSTPTTVRVEKEN